MCSITRRTVLKQHVSYMTVCVNVSEQKARESSQQSQSDYCTCSQEYNPMVLFINTNYTKTSSEQLSIRIIKYCPLCFSHGECAVCQTHTLKNKSMGREYKER